MKAFILAAGLGKRLRPLTDIRPKPLIAVGGKPLILWHIEKLRNAGITNLVINCHWLAEQLMDYLGDGEKFGVQIQWSQESALLNTGGGIRAALPLMGDEAFALISADVWSDFDYHWLANTALQNDVAHLVMVPNPEFSPDGDFALNESNRLSLVHPGEPSLTYSGIGLLSPAWVSDWSMDNIAFSWLGPLRQAVQQGQVEGSLHLGRWTDVGTPARLAQLQEEFD